MSVVVEYVVNRRSQRKYEEFATAMSQAWIVLEEIRRAIQKMDGASVPEHRFRASSVEDLLGLNHKAEESLQALEGRSRRFKADLVSREWRL